MNDRSAIAVAALPWRALSAPSDPARLGFASTEDIAGAAGSPCEVILTTPRIAEADRWRNDIRERFTGTDIAIEFLHLPGGGMDALGAAARRRGAVLVVVGADGHAGALLDRLPCSLLLVR